MIFNKINTFCPQIVFIQDMNSVSIEMLKFMKSKKIILVGEIASRIPPLKFLKKYDLIFSALPQFVNYFRKNHLKSEYLPLAFNNAVLKKINLPLRSLRFFHFFIEKVIFVIADVLNFFSLNKK